MKYKIDENRNGIDISVSDAKNDKQKLLEAFRECQEGEDIQLRLKSKDGEVIDKSEI